MAILFKLSILSGALATLANAACLSSGDQTTINNMFQSGGAGTVVQICQGVTWPTDGGVVIFGSPGSTVTGNTIIGSPIDEGFGAINMVDGEYDGSYAGVTVSNNIIQGGKIFNLGIGIGANVWSFNDPGPLHGPATVTGNKFSGNVTFAIALNGWDNGITITNNDVSGIPSPHSTFADASQCVTGIQSLFSESASLVWFPAGVTGPTNLQSDFVAGTSNLTNFLCTGPPLLTEKDYGLNQLSVVSDSAPFATLPHIIMKYQGDSNTVVYDTSFGEDVPVWASGHTISSCGNPSTCMLHFQGDGNLVAYNGSTPLWSTGTAGRGNLMKCIDQAPWIQIVDVDGNVIWDTTMNK